ncbi:Small RNA 2'-O-methyltransferase, partial [Trichostrongylus colubriformis]
MEESMGCHFSDDGWPLQYDFDRILHSYEVIYEEVERNPVEVKVEEAPVHMYDYDEVISKPRFFTPPLQYQRNAFVRDILYGYMEESGEKIRKLAVLGCGSLSLERFLIALMGSMGIERVMSVDIDETEIAKGLKLLNIAEHQNENVVCNSNSLPVLLDVYKGDILEYDERLAGAGCVCSTEVIEHIPKEDATRYVKFVLSQIHPQLFIVSTPNHEYNKAFGLQEGQFRHGDHKFEFTR